MNFSADIGVQEIELETLAEYGDQSSTQVRFLCVNIFILVFYLLQSTAI